VRSLQTIYGLRDPRVEWGTRRLHGGRFRIYQDTAQMVDAWRS